MFKTIVLGLDGSESSDRALLHTTTLAKEQGATVRVVHVIEIAAGRGGGLVHLDEDELKAKIEQQTRDLVEAGVDAALELHSVMAGGPAHVIAEVARRSNADLIVTGTRGHTAAAGILLGSVTHRLLHLAHCPLLVIPAGGARTRRRRDRGPRPKRGPGANAWPDLDVAATRAVVVVAGDHGTSVKRARGSWRCWLDDESAAQRIDVRRPSRSILHCGNASDTVRIS